MYKWILIGLFCLPGLLRAQRLRVEQRVILIGDAGEMDRQQGGVITTALEKVIAGRTRVMYLGDNIYPRGMGLPGSRERAETEAILRSQYQPFRAAGVPVDFIPGNHDWDRMGNKGLAKVRAQWSFLESQHDSLLRAIPADGCPGPEEIPVGKDLVIVAFDSEWWLFQHEKETTADCDCRTKDQVTEKLEALFYKNRNKVILLAMHHPFQTYGRHGGYYNLKDHLFPFTAISPKLYIPLPVAGSLYPFLRRTFPNPEDRPHPQYREMIKRVDGVFSGFPNLVHVSGHDHGLQLIKKGDDLQVVSGSGAKHSFVARGANSLYGSVLPGFVTADLMSDKSLQLTYYAQTDSGFREVFAYNKPYSQTQSAEQAIYRSFTQDSMRRALLPRYDSVGRFHRLLFGENYRREYAQVTTLPVIRISEAFGGLRPLKPGGGHQSRSLRLADSAGREYVLRSVQKYPDVLIPERLRETFAKDIVEDQMSAQHPFSALAVPPLAAAAGVPHSNPVIGVVAPEDALGIYNKTFGGIVALLEEREPAGKSDNTPKMLDALNSDNDNTIDRSGYLKARLLDVLIGDWDRHGDQWRWGYTKDGKNKHYFPVPRDRDQVFYKSEGLVVRYATAKSLLPFMQGFAEEIKDINTNLWEARQTDSRILVPMPLEQWQSTTQSFVDAMTDQVFEAGLRRLPQPAYQLRYKELFDTLQARRAILPDEMNKFYRFINKIADIQLSDKNEAVSLTAMPDGSASLLVRKINKEGQLRDSLVSKSFDPQITKEIRLYLNNGKDSVHVDLDGSPVRLRIIAKGGDKKFDMASAGGDIRLYKTTAAARLTGPAVSRLRITSSDDSLNTAFVPVNLYHVPVYLLNAGLNLDDGLLLGATYKYTRQEGFRKEPFASSHRFTALHAFATEAFQFKYNGEWTQLLGKADLLTQLNIKAPNNTMNFFGRGNETPFDRRGDYKRFYRTRFNLYTLETALRWRQGANSQLFVGPSLQYYHLDPEENEGRFISRASSLGSYDSLSVGRNKMHAGLSLHYLMDGRNNRLLPQWGVYVSFRAEAWAGLTGGARSYAQIMPQLALYKSLNMRGSIVLANRTGGTFGIGHAAFYQSAFLGGQDNLLGFRQYRFAGRHSLYNNLEMRVKLADFASYILPGQFGLIGFYDTGRVWEPAEASSKWHYGLGGGPYFAPAQIAVVKFLMGHSEEGWYPYLTVGMRF
ncbi:BamA/TamA family outer membrane protein [Pedobacter sp. SYP-B3415]|uniref:BamA/TamA family outer membrane protein n=1 Tax=Pedobacter sp. SYP-B3415 TaxID=2496641 RepID=UPI00101BE08D|nr:BamA/TamA family outer membrane protein [Pedobacter sp. SYP-B3415]